MQLSKAIKAIEQHGILLVFPIKNAKEPRSLWSVFYPRSKMLWDWNDDADNRVAGLWGLMKRLSDGRAVVYSKWFQGRATFFSRDLFTAMLCVARENRSAYMAGLDSNALRLLETLHDESPLSTKVLKGLTDLQGRFHEAAFQRGMKQLFRRLLIVGFGEVDDGAFPSLAVGATKVLYEDLWTDAEKLKVSDARATIERYLPAGSLTRRFYDRSVRVDSPVARIDS